MKLSRFLNYALRLALVSVVAALVITTGCKPQGSNPEANGRETVAIALEAEPTTIDPTAVLDVYSQTLATSVHSPLAWVDQRGQLKMALASSITVTPDGKQCQIQLKKGAAFWDGSPVRAEDVRFSIERFRRSSHPHRWICDRIAGVQEFDKKATNHIAGIVVQDDSRLTIYYSKPEPDAALFLSSLATAVVKEGSDTIPEKPFGSQIIGCGPFKPESFKAGDTFDVVRNTGFPLSNNVAHLRFVVMVDTQARLQAARLGQIEVVRLKGSMLAEACEQEGGRLKPKPEFAADTIITASANELAFLMVNYGSDNLSRMSVAERRQWHNALSDAMARESLVDDLYLGPAGAEPAYAIAPPSTIDSEDVVRQTATRERLMGPTKLTLLSANDPTSRQLCAYVQGRCQTIGLDLNIQYVDLPSLIQHLIEKKFEVAGLWVEQQIPASGPIPWISFFDPKAPLSVFGEGIPEVTGQLDDVRGITNAASRRAAYAKIVEFIDSRQTTWVPLVSRKAVFLVSKDVHLFLDRNGTAVTGFVGIP